jgi:hypothetical protein
LSQGENDVAPCTDVVHFNSERLRSLRQAQWAAFFQHAQVWFIYGVVSYHLPGGEQYTPHFWLPRQRLWFQVGDEQDDGDTSRWRRFASVIRRRPYGVTVGYAPGANGHDDPSFILSSQWRPLNSLYSRGEIPDPATMSPTGPSTSPPTSMYTDGADGYQWTVCPTCDVVDADRDGRTNQLRCGHGQPGQAQNPHADHPRLLAAYRFARGTRVAQSTGRCGACADVVEPADLVAPGTRPDQPWDHAACRLPTPSRPSGAEQAMAPAPTIPQAGRSAGTTFRYRRPTRHR